MDEQVEGDEHIGWARTWRLVLNVGVLGLFVTAAVVGLAFCFAVGFYSTFELSPEDAGLGVDFLAVRGGFMVMGVAILLGVLTPAYRSLAVPFLSGPGAGSRVFRLCSLLVTTVVASGVAITASVLTDADPRTFAGSAVMALSAMLAFPFLLAAWLWVSQSMFEDVHVSEGTEVMLLRRPSKRSLACWLAVALVLVGGSLYALGRSQANYVRDGNEINVGWFTVSHYDVSTVNSDGTVESLGCMADLGSAGGRVVLFDYGRRKVVDFPDLTTIRVEADGSCPKD